MSNSKSKSNKRLSLLVFILATLHGFAWAFLFHPSVDRRIMDPVHCWVFFTWTLSWIFLWRAGFNQEAFLGFEITVAIVMAAIAEYIQKWIPPHNPELRGFYASLEGIICALVALRIWERVNIRKRQDIKINLKSAPKAHRIMNEKYFSI